MTKDEFFEEQYVLNDREYLKRFCFNEAEAYCLEKELSYDHDCWLFEHKKNYELEDDYGEESEP